MTITTSTSVPEGSNTATIPSDFLTTAQVARRLGIGKTSIYEWLAKGDIAYHRMGRLIRVRESDVADFIHRNRVEHAPRRRYGRYPQA
jgi:excisionase family DNA binding protein